MDDTGVTDASTLLTFTANTEVGGSMGNFAGGVVTGRVNQTGARDNPQGNQRVRGLSSAQLTRDYFRSVIPFDRYNTTRVTLNRGPNSILFGVGATGGVINNTTKKALLSDADTTFGFQIDNEGSHRATFDVNEVLIEGRLAVRVDLMSEGLEYKQEPAFQDDDRAFIALTGILREGKRGEFLGRTTLRANAEIASLEENPVNVIPPNDGFTDWFQWDHTLPKSKYSALGVNVPGFINTDRLIPKYQRDAYEGSWGKSVLGWPFYQQLGLFYSGQADGGPSVGIPGKSFNGFQGSGYANGGGLVTTRSIFGNTQYTGFVDPVIMDREVFDYENYTLTGDTNRRWESYDVKNAVIEQLFWDGQAGLEVAYDAQNYHRASFFPFSGPDGGVLGNNSIGIDLQDTLMYGGKGNAVDNPNAGRPLVRNIGLPTQHQWVDRDTIRATAYGQVDAKDYFDGFLGSILGNHTLTGVYSKETTEVTGMTSNLYWGGNYGPDSPYTSGYAYLPKGEGDWGRLVVGMAYVGESALGADGPGDVRITPMNAKLPKDGEVYNMWYVDYTDPAKPIKEGDFQVKELWAYGNMREDVIESWSSSIHSKFLNDHIITLAGYRYDQVTSRFHEDWDADEDDSTNFKFWDEDFGGYAGGMDPDMLVLRDDADVMGRHSVAYSVVARFPEEVLFDLPFESELSVFYNYSDSFDPTAGRRSSVLGDVLDPPVGETKEYGFMLEMFDRKLSVRANWFETSSVGDSLPGGASGAVNWSTNNITGWMGRLNEAETAGRPFYTPGVDPSEWDPVEGPHDALTRMYATFDSALGFTDMKTPQHGAYNEFVNGDGETVIVNSYDDMYELYASLVPEPVRSRLNPRYDRGTGEVVSNDFGARVATTNSVAEGFEVEVTANPSKGLRLMANVSFQETTLNDVAPNLANLVGDIAANLERSGLSNIRDTPLANANSTFFSRYDSRVLSPIAAEQTKEGQVREEQRKWRVNAVANYKFGKDSFLRGFGLGGGVRWQSEIATGYPQFRNEQGFVVPILDEAFYDPAVWSGNVNLSYNKKLGHIDWTLRLYVWNAFGTDGLTAVRRNPDGVLAVARFSPPTTVTLSNTFKF